MTLINPCNEAFVPLLENYFAEKIATPGSTSKILKLHRLLHDQPKSILMTDRKICIGLGAYETGVDIVFIWDVADVIYLAENPIPKEVKIVCNLETHFHELVALGYDVYSVYSKLNRNVPIIEFKDEDFKLLLRTRSGVMVNPTSASEGDILDCRAYIKFNEEAFVPSDDNYANEFCEVYQMAAISGAQVFTATSKAEVQAIQNALK